MNAKADQASGTSAGDIAKLAVAFLLVAGGLFAFYWFGSLPQLARTGGLVAALVAAFGLVAFTALGRRVRHFVSESHFEMRKVVWPTRDETVKTTLIIVVVVVILSLLLGLIDLILKSVVLEWLLKLGK